MDANTKIKIRNRNNGVVGYAIPDMGNLRRRFTPGEVKEVTFEEIQKLSYQAGGDVLLKDYLVIENQDAVDALYAVEPEYFYTDEDVKKLLTSGTYDQFIDCLNFAPKGVIELIKKYAVELELNDVKKREAIFKKTGYNVTSAIDIKRESEETPATENEKVRKAEPINIKKEEAAPQRRAATPKYNVVTQQG